MVAIPSASSALMQKAALTVVSGVGVTPLLTFKYNPTEYTVAKSAQWNRPRTKSAESATVPEFGGSNPMSVQMEVFFDAFEEAMGDVSGDVETLLSWTKPTELSLINSAGQPPLLKFLWGMNPVLMDFQGYLESVSARYTLFRIDGTPIRATANITLQEAPTDDGGTNPTSGSREGRRAVVLAAGDSLQSVAYREYGNAAYWRGLAAFNDIDNPLRLMPGTRLLVPTPAEAAGLS